ncbi:hypothetical protein FKM82_024340 [Ascaphus truei]
MRFNTDKCTVMHLGNKNKQASYKFNGDKLGESLMEKDLGVLVDSRLSNSAQCHAVAAKANKILTCIKREMDGRKVNMCLYKALVRPHLKYGVLGTNPYKRYYGNRECREEPPIY